MSGTSYKLVVLGDGEVGKSSLISQFIQRKFDSYYDPTIDDIFTHWTKINGEWRELELFDTAGKEEFSVMKDHFIRKGIVFFAIQTLIFIQLQYILMFFYLITFIIFSSFQFRLNLQIFISIELFVQIIYLSIG
jgi:hypothetical protein